MVTEEEKAMKYILYLDAREKELERLKSQRDKDPSPRWRANYDLIFAQIIAYKVRMYEYGAYLEEFVNDLQAYHRNPTDKNNRFKPPPLTRLLVERLMPLAKNIHGISAV